MKVSAIYGGAEAVKRLSPMRQPLPSFALFEHPGVDYDDGVRLVYLIGEIYVPKGH